MTRTAHRYRTSLIAGVLGLGALGLAACSRTPASAAAKASAGPVTLVVYSALGYDQAMTTAFTKATGIPVKLDDNSTGPLLTQIVLGPGAVAGPVTA
jgi:iron(III) transport system substrate-binding protein